MFLEDQPNSWYFGFAGGHLMYILHMYTITAGLSVTKTQNPIKWICLVPFLVVSMTIGARLKKIYSRYILQLQKEIL